MSAVENFMEHNHYLEINYVYCCVLVAVYLD